MDAATPIMLEQSHTLPEFSTFLSRIEPQIGLLGGRRYHYGTSAGSVSMHAIAAKFESLCQQTEEETVSEGEVRDLRETITSLDAEGSELLRRAPWWKKIVIFIFQIATLQFILGNPIARATHAASKINRRTSAFLDRIVESVRKGPPFPASLNSMANPTLYQEFIYNLMRNQPNDLFLQILERLPLPGSPDPQFATLREQAQDALKKAFRANTATQEYLQRLSLGPELEEQEQEQMKVFFQEYIPQIFPSVVNTLTQDMIKPITILGRAITRLPLPKRTDFLKDVLEPHKGRILQHFFQLMEHFLVAYEEERSDLVDLLLGLQFYRNDIIEVLFNTPLANYPEWREIQKKFELIYKNFFSHKAVFEQKHFFSVENKPKELSETCNLENKAEINDWLRSLSEAFSIVRDLSRESEITLGTGMKRKIITQRSLAKDFPELKVNATLSDEDKKCILCWLSFTKIVAYFREQGVENPEEATTSLLIASVQDRPAYPFLVHLGVQAGHMIFPQNYHPHNFTFFYDKTSSTPSLRIHTAYIDRERCFLRREVTSSMTLSTPKGEGTLCEHIEFKPRHTLFFF